MATEKDKLERLSRLFSKWKDEGFDDDDFLFELSLILDDFKSELDTVCSRRPPESLPDTHSAGGKK